MKTVNNLWGWQVTAPETVRADQWQAVHDTYVRDRRNLGLNDWFERHNPTAQAQVIERMVEAIRKEYWDADAQTRRDLVERWQALERDHGVRIGEPATRDFIQAMAAGFGLDAASPAPDPGAASAAMAETVRGAVMEPVAEPPPDEPSPWRPWAGLVALALCLSAGAVRQIHGNRRIEL